MRIFRVEASFSIIDSSVGYKRTNLGPYTGRDDAGKVYGKYFNTRTLPYNPEPEEDGIKHPGYNYYYGFSSLRELVKWFEGCSFALQDAGYVVVEYECADMYIKLGGTQLAFEMARAIPIRFYSRREYLTRFKDETYGSRRLNRERDLAQLTFN